MIAMYLRCHFSRFFGEIYQQMQKSVVDTLIVVFVGCGPLPVGGQCGGARPNTQGSIVWTLSQLARLDVVYQIYQCLSTISCTVYIISYWRLLHSPKLCLVSARIAKRLGHGCSLPDLIGAAGESTAAEDLLLTVGATLATTARRGGSRLQAVFPRAFPGSFHHVSNQ